MADPTRRALGVGGTSFTIPAGGVAQGHTIVLTCFLIQNGSSLTAPLVTISDAAGNSYAIHDYAIGPTSLGGQAAFAFVASAQNVQALLAGDQIQLHNTATSFGAGIASAVMFATDWTGLGPASFDGFAHQALRSQGTAASPTATATTTYQPDAVEGIIAVYDLGTGGSIAITPTAGLAGQSSPGSTQSLLELYGITPAQSAHIAAGVTANTGANLTTLTCVCTFQGDRRLATPILTNITNGLLSSPDRWLVEVMSPDLSQSWEIDLYHLSATLKWRGLSTGQLDVPSVALGFSACVEGNYVRLVDLISGDQSQFIITDVHWLEAADKAFTKSCVLSDLRYAVYARIVAPRQTGQTNSASSGTLTGTVEATYTFTGSLYSPANGWVSISGATESLCKTLITQNCVLGNPLPNFRVGGNQQKGVVQFVKVTGEPLSQRLPQLLAVDDFGDTVRLLAGGTLEYDVIKGVDRSSGTRNQQVFSVDLDNVSEVQYTTGRSGHINAVLVIGKAAPDVAPNDGTGAAPVSQTARPMMWVEDSAMITAHGRQEASYDAADAVTANEFITAGLWYLAMHQEVSAITFVAREGALARYGSGWRLGDLVSVEQTDWNVIQNVRIQSIQIDTGSPDLKLDSAAETINFMQYAADAFGTVGGTQVPTSGVPPIGIPGGLPAGVTPAMAQRMGENAIQTPPEFNLQVTVGRDRPAGSWRGQTLTAIRRP